jgi:predicted TIM-barrel fold metal-dependent hydrolase
MTVHDAHCHFFSRRFFETLARDAKDLPPGNPAEAIPAHLGWDVPGEPDALADRWLAELDRHHVGRAALIASVPGDEVSVAEAVAHHPDRFVGFFMLNPTAPESDARARRAFIELGLRTVCLFPAMHHYDLSDAAWVVEAAAAQGRTAVFVHCGLLSVGVRKKLGLPSRFDIGRGNPLGVQALAVKYPQVPFIIPHFGAGFFREALMAADAAPNIYLDTSSSNGWIRYHPGLTLVQVFKSALDVLGPDRLLFGTDSSFFPRGWQQPIFEAQQATLELAGADEAAQTKIFHQNFERLFS